MHVQPIGKTTAPARSGFVMLTLFRRIGSMHPAIATRRDELVAICRRYGLRRVAVFGSGARSEDFDPARSDVDLLADFPADTSTDVYVEAKAAFETALGRKVDLVDRKAIEASRNYIRRRAILAEAEPIDVT